MQTTRAQEAALLADMFAGGLATIPNRAAMTDRQLCEHLVAVLLEAIEGQDRVQ